MASQVAQFRSAALKHIGDDGHKKSMSVKELVVSLSESKLLKDGIDQNEAAAIYTLKDSFGEPGPLTNVLNKKASDFATNLLESAGYRFFEG